MKKDVKKTEEKTEKKIVGGLPQFKEDSVEFTTADSGKMTALLYVGYQVKNTTLYAFKPHTIGVVMASKLSDAAILVEKNKMTEFARELYKRIPPQASLQYNVYGYHLGAECEVNEQGDVEGEWPLITTVKIPYAGTFVITGDKVPEGLTPLKLLWP